MLYSGDKQHYPLMDVKEPNLLRDMFPYTEPPNTFFDDVNIPVKRPKKIWITDTTFRDGQQARPPYSVEEITRMFEFMSKMGGPNGIIRQTEFFLFSDKDKKAVDACRDLNLPFPEITSWIRATLKDLELAKQMKVKETGILTSVSDYHIFMKLKSNRKQIMDKYLGVVKETLAADITPRCHFEDVTRSDIYGFVLPFAEELKKISDEAKRPIKVRLCDTMGFGVPFVAAALPRSVPKLFYLFQNKLGFPSSSLEWHGHNDFHLVIANSMAAWLYGGSAVNGTLIGFGERTGNPPIESLLIHYISLMHNRNGIDTRAITEMAEYFKTEMNVKIPDNYPMVGDKFNVTRAGIHADGMIKNEEIYNIFDTDRVLARPLGVIVTDKSGVAGIALWINMHYKLKADKEIDKKHPGVAKIYEWVMEEYDQGRIAGLADEELEKLVKKFIPEVIFSEYDKLKLMVKKHTLDLIKDTAEIKDIRSMNPETMKPVLEKILEENIFIQLITITDVNGKMITDVFKKTDKDHYKNFRENDFSASEWFIRPMKDGKPFLTNFYTSRYTNELCMTVSAPIAGKDDRISGVISCDIQFEAALKLE